MASFAAILRTVVAAALCCAVSEAFCSTVSLRTETKYDRSKNEIQWTLSNCGDSTADSVVIVFPDGKSDPLEIGFIDGGMSVTGIVRGVCAPCDSGAAPLTVSYEDSTGKSHSVVSFVNFAGKNLGKGINVGISAPEEDAFYRPFCCKNAGAVGRGTFFVSGFIGSGGKAHAKVRLRIFVTRGIVPEKTDFFVETDEFGIFSIDIGVENRLFGEAGNFPLAVIADYAIPGGDPATDIAVVSLENVEPVSDVGPESEILPFKLPLWLSVMAAAAFIAAAHFGKYRKLSPCACRAFDLTAVAAVTIYVSYLINLPLAFSGGLCVGGDTPAHHYLVSHVAETGSAVSWASGWWSGFPMFRYYFPLPYFLMAMASKILPHNAVFNVGMCLGAVLLPLSFYIAAEIARIPRPLPAIAAWCALPILADNTHVMWGVNFYSTLAGMIANSWSFALFAPALACAVRDAADGRIRLHTPLLTAAVILSHFFTSVLLAAMLGVCGAVFLFMKRDFRAAAVVAAEGVLALLLSAWWVVPLLFLRRWSVDFGTQWSIFFFKQLHPFVLWFFIPCMAAGFAAWLWERHARKMAAMPKCAESVRTFGGWCAVCGVLAVVSLALFFLGVKISHVFVNCRLWPFIIAGLILLQAGAFAFAGRGHPVLYAAAWAVLCMGLPWDTSLSRKNPAWSYAQYSRAWAEYNFKGLDALKYGSAGREIAESLRGTPGRMSQDLHDGNSALGSSRFFEIMPYLSGKPIIEGGIVNSALGALAAYAVQGEVSDNSAGFPLRVKPRVFNPEAGLRHLEFMNVRQFVARSQRTRDAFAADPAWVKKQSFGGGRWTLFEAADPVDSLVRAWNAPVHVFESDDFQRDLLEWVYCPAMILDPCVFVEPGGVSPEGVPADPHEKFTALLKASLQKPPPEPGWENRVSSRIDYRRLRDGGIAFDTTKTGKPHLIAESWFPNWRVKGANKIYFAGPGYMMVYPETNHIEITWGTLPAEKAGVCMTWCGIFLIFVIAGFKMTGRFYDKRRTVRIA